MTSNDKQTKQARKQNETNETTNKQTMKNNNHEKQTS